MKKLLSLAILVASALACSHSALAALCQEGESAQVLWKGYWYSATVLKTKPESCYVHYRGYNDSWDEWVGADRIKVHGKDSRASYQSGEAIQVLWKDRWWPARILDVKDDQLYIHYDGFGKEWDEWVGPNRYRRSSEQEVGRGRRDKS